MAEAPLAIDTTVSLNDGNRMPLLGLGVWASSTCEKACLTSFDEGYRHIDTAQLYGNETEVGQALKRSPLPRSSIYVTSKVWHNKHTRRDAYNAVKESLASLDLDYIDLYLLHNPAAGPQGRHQAYLGLQDALQEGKLKSIGVSNFTPGHIRALMSSDGVTMKPSINQVELHPWNQQQEIVRYCKAEGIVVQAYCPLTRGIKLGDPTIAEIAKKHAKSAAQVVLRWILQQGIVAIPKSENPGRIKENADLYDFVLDDEDLRKIAKLDIGQAGSVADWDPWKWD